jgi:uncharacterized protein (DUF342 family)
MAAPVQKKYFIFQEEQEIMMVINVPPDQLDDKLIQAFLDEVESRGLGTIIFPDVERLFRNAKQGEVIHIGGIKTSEEREVEVLEEEESVDIKDIPFVIEVSGDSKEAYLVLENMTDSISRKQIDKSLVDAGVVYGIKEEQLEYIVEKWPKIFRELIAEGSEPIDGGDATLQLTKDFKENLIPEETDDGQVDFKQLNLIMPIDAGEILQTRTPPVQGTPGYNIFGKEILANPGKDKKLDRGENTQISEDGLQLISTKAGFLQVSPWGHISVRPVYSVPGDVDYSIGNINYKSDVLVRGDVRAGFEVKSGGDIRIYGAVEDAYVEAKGDVIINGGVLSSGKARIKAGGDVHVGFIQNGAIEAGGSIFIRIEALGSRLVAKKDIEVLKREGRIVGGDIEVGGWVVAQVIGAENCPLQIIKFNLPSQTDNNADQDRAKYCFVSAKSLNSPIRVMFGAIIAGISADDTPVTVSLKDDIIEIDNTFVDPGKLKALRRQRSEEG